MQTSGMSVDEREDRISDDSHPQRVDFARQIRACSNRAAHAPGYFPRTTLTERVVEFLERLFVQ